VKTKEFNKPKPYCYILTRLSDGKKYFGVRWANVGFNRTPKEDFGIYYFSSHKKLRKPFKKNPNKFSFKFVATFSTENEAREHEVKRNKKLIRNPDWLNSQAFPAIINLRKYWKGKKHSEESRRKMSEGQKGRKHSKETLKKLSKATSGKNNPNYGNKWPPKTRKKISKGIRKSFSEGRDPWNKGKTGVYTKKVLKKMSKTIKERWEKGLYTYPPFPVLRGKDHPSYGRKLTEEHKKILSITHKNKRVTKKHRKNMSIGQINRTDKHVIELNGKKHNVKSFCKEIDISTTTHWNWSRLGLSHKEMVDKSKHPWKKVFVKFKGNKVPMTEFIDSNGISLSSWYRWKKKNLTLSQMIKRNEKI